MARVNPKITPEIRAALSEHPAGPVQLDDDSSSDPVFVVRLSDISNLQALVDDRIRKELAEADADIAADKVGPWDAEEIKQRGRARLSAQMNDE